MRLQFQKNLPSVRSAHFRTRPIAVSAAPTNRLITP